MYIHVYMYTYIHMCVYIYIYITYIHIIKVDFKVGAYSSGDPAPIRRRSRWPSLNTHGLLKRPLSSPQV